MTLSDHTRIRVLQILHHYQDEWVVEDLIGELCEGARGNHYRSELRRLSNLGAAHYRRRQVPGEETRYTLWKLRKQR